MTLLSSLILLIIDHDTVMPICYHRYDALVCFKRFALEIETQIEMTSTILRTNDRCGYLSNQLDM